jgi:hypothetical protein
MATPAHVFTIARVAQIIREDEQLLWDLAINMEPEDGCLWVYGTDEQHTMAPHGSRAGIFAGTDRRA